MDSFDRFLDEMESNYIWLSQSFYSEGITTSSDTTQEMSGRIHGETVIPVMANDPFDSVPIRADTAKPFSLGTELGAV